LSMRVAAWELLALVVLPVAAACWLGMLLRSLIERRGKLWGAWLALLAASGALWVYLVVETVL
jgi:hypothetical protein